MLLLTPILRRLLVMAVVLAIPLVACELIARKLIGDAVKSAVRARVGVASSVSFGSSPILLQLIHGRIDTVTVGATDARIQGLPPLRLNATLHDVHLANLTSLQGGIGSLTIDAHLSPGGVRLLLATPTCVEALPASLRRPLSAVPRVYVFPGRIDLLPPRGRSVEVRLAPLARAGSLVFVISAVDRRGVPASAATLALIRRRTQCSRSLPNLPFGVSLASATAATGALELAFTGTNASFSAIG